MPNTKQPEEKPLPDTDKHREISNESRVEKEIEYGGPKGKEPTRYGDWEKKGRCIDF